MPNPKPEMTCVKCLSKDIYTAWHEDRYACGWSSRGFQFEGEHLHHGCRNCRYEWSAPTADAGVKP